MSKSAQAKSYAKIRALAESMTEQQQQKQQLETEEGVGDEAKDEPSSEATAQASRDMSTAFSGPTASSSNAALDLETLEKILRKIHQSAEKVQRAKSTLYVLLHYMHVCR